MSSNRSDSVDALVTTFNDRAWEPDPSDGWAVLTMGSQPYWWMRDEELMLEFLVRAACPIVCKGILSPPENWHQLCIDKGKQALAVLRG